jgi:hypothetical protein
MTWLWGHRVSVLVLALFVAAGFGLRACHDLAGTRAASARAEEEAALRAAGLTVERDAVQGELARAASDAKELRGQLEAARRADPGVRVVEVIRWRTRPEAAGGAPRDPAPAGGGAAVPPVQPATGVPAGVGCLLVAGDLGEVRVVEAQLQGDAGARVVVGSAEAWRVDPGPPTRLFGGPLRTPVELAVVEPERRPPRWGAGAAAFAGPGGWAVGPAIALPPLRLWGWQAEVVVGAGAGPSGAWQAGATGIVRW